MDTNKTFGIVYVATHERFVPFALHSIKSLRKVSSHSVTVCCVSELFDAFTGYNVSLVKVPNQYLGAPPDAKSQERPNWQFYCKVFALRLMPYDINLYLDADTEILKDPILAYDPDYDLAFAHECKCDWDNKKFIRMQNGFNAGVAIFKKSSIVEEFFKEVERDFVYESVNPYHSDQTSINRMIREKFRNKIKVNILDQRWNVRLPIWNKITDPYILHSHNLHKKDLLNKEIENWS